MREGALPSGVVDAAAAPSLARALLDGGDPAQVALVEDGARLTYGALAGRVAARREELGLGSRSVVVLAGATSAELVVTYLALLEAGHVPLLAGDHAERQAAAWSPAAVVTARADGIEVDRRPGPAPTLHPDLALLLSTSGSTGSPKLVRLSHANLVSNAEAIATALDITARDRAITSLPLHYCYGLSVLHSHLAAGASVVLTTASVVDPCFAAAVHDHGVTGIAGVPHTFEMLEAAGPERIHAPSLRVLTQAGGRMAPEAVTRWRERAEGWGVDLFVMYGQTEATARMAILPPERAAGRPGAIGVPIPGGALEVRPVEGRDDDVGELVYRGPNVMLGYAAAPADLALGATLDELRTGDLGRFDPDHGVFEVVGRLSRFTKPFGLRIDLDAVEDRLRPALGEVAAGGDDTRLVVAAPGAEVERVRALAAAATGLRPGLVVPLVDAPLPRTASGKVDHAALAAAADATAEDPAAEAPSVSAVLASVLGRRELDPAESFVSAGGDSLSYVEATARLERLVGQLPDDWHHRPVAELEALAPAGRRRSRVDTTVLLRAVGICTVVATHMHLTYFPGGAHLLLAVAGFNLSRFQLGLDAASERLRAGLRTVARVAVPTVAWAAVVLAVSDSYGWSTLTLLNDYLGPAHHEDGHWHFWFIEAFVQLTLAATLLLAVPWVRRVDRRLPYGLPLALLGATLLLRDVTWWGIDDPTNLRFRTHGIAFFFVLGWLAHRSRRWWHKLATTALVLATIPGFFHNHQREWFVMGAIVLVTWARSVPLPRRLLPLVSVLAAASMWILIAHFQIWPPLTRLLPLPAAYVLTLASGVGVWFVAERLPRAARRWADQASRRPSTISTVRSA